MAASVDGHRPARRGARPPRQLHPRQVALTFDAEHPDRPADPGATLRLAEELARLGVSATFFIQGRWAEAYPLVARELAAAGHLIGNHSYYHARMPLLSGMGLRADVHAAEKVIRDVTGVDPRPWFRLPFGSGARNRLLLDRLATLGYRHVGWTISPQDWEPQRRAAEIEAHVVDQSLAATEPSIVLLHGWPNVTWKAIDQIVVRLRDAGTALVRVDDLPDQAIVIGTEAPPASPVVTPQVAGA